MKLDFYYNNKKIVGEDLPSDGFYSLLE